MRGQIGAEYVFLLALVFVIVATSILQTFRDIEINLALSTARMSCSELASQNSSLQCFVMGYSVGDSVVNITPQLSSYYSAGDKEDLKNLTLVKLNEVFHPDAVADTNSECAPAAYYNYCLVFV
ncbi:MAG: hypothetical protein V1787_00960 [Candidatus Micrarchaeota archaeon]